MTGMPKKWKPDPVPPADLGGRTPPNDPGAEAALISALMSRACVDEVRELAKPDHFYGAANAQIVRACYALADAGSPIDVATVAGWLRDRDWLIGVGGIAYLAKVLESTPTIAFPMHYARIVATLAKVREMIVESSLISAEGYGDVGDAPTWLEASAARLSRVADTMPGRAETLLDFGDVVEARSRELAEMWAGRRESSGLKIPIASVDSLLDGHHLGRAVVVAGHTGSGKTVYAQQFGEAVAGSTYDGAVSCVAYLSLEMIPAQLADRSLSRTARVRPRAMREGKLDPDELARLDWARGVMRRKPLSCTFHDLTIVSLRAAVRRAHLRAAEWSRRTGRLHKLRLVILDHVHILDLEGASEDARASQAQKLGDIVRALKRIAVNDALCMMILAQFNRDATGRPQIRHIRDASAIEQIADQVVLIHRPWLAIEDKGSEAARACIDQAEIISGKARDDQQGSRQVRFVGEHFYFEDT